MSETSQWCSRCKADRPTGNFGIKKNGQRQKTCQYCRGMDKTYSAAHREEAKARASKWYHEHKSAASNEYRKKYYQENKDRAKELRKEYEKDGRHKCEHKVKKVQCKICHPKGHLKSIVSSRIRSALMANKSKKSIE